MIDRMFYQTLLTEKVTLTSEQKDELIKVLRNLIMLVRTAGVTNAIVAACTQMDNRNHNTLFIKSEKARDVFKRLLSKANLCLDNFIKIVKANSPLFKNQVISKIDSIILFIQTQKPQENEAN